MPNSLRLASQIGMFCASRAVGRYPFHVPDAADWMRFVTNKAAAAEADGPETAQGLSSEHQRRSDAG
jgi:hypothetical protein